VPRVADSKLLRNCDGDDQELRRPMTKCCVERRLFQGQSGFYPAPAIELKSRIGMLRVHLMARRNVGRGFAFGLLRR